MVDVIFTFLILFLSVPACPDDKFGWDCQYSCNCPGSCWQNNGLCKSDCIDGYTGIDCQTHKGQPWGALFLLKSVNANVLCKKLLEVLELKNCIFFPYCLRAIVILRHRPIIIDLK